MTAMSRLKIQVSGDTGHMDNYCAALRSIGAEPLAGYCPAPNPNCGGLLLCGGGDIEPVRYGQPDRGSQPPDLARDKAELELFQVFHRAGKPILGICRGMQLINVALGGTLIQDLPQEQKAFHCGGKADMVHPLRALEGSVLHRLYGPVFSVNSSHHQAAARLGEGLIPCAWSEGGVAEAAEHVSLPVLGVQFHPERMSWDRRRPDAADGAPILLHFLSLCVK